MRTMVGLHAAPEVRGFNEDLAEHYHLPRFGIGGLTGAKDVDQQAAFEAALTLLASSLSGAQLIHDVGYMDNGTTGSLDQLVICHEIIGWVKQYMEALVVDDDHLALDLIDEVVKADGDFLQARHTAVNCRTDHYPDLLDRGNFAAWEARGCQTLRDRAGKKVDEILQSHEPPPLSQGVRRKLRSFVESD